MLRTLLMVPVFLGVFGFSTAAWATLDGGTGTRLVALIGEPEVFALFCEGDINEGCQNMYLVELGASEFARLHVHSCDDDCDTSEDAVEEYLARAPAEIRSAIGQFSPRKIEDYEIVLYDITHDVSTPVQLVPPEKLKRFRPVLRVNSRVPSMGIWEATGGTGSTCTTNKEGSKWTCPGCTRVERSLDGLTFSTPVCEQPSPSPSCDCTGTATTYRFLIVDSERDRRHLGNRLFVQPGDLLQSLEGGGVEDNHAQPNLEIVDLQALVLSDSILFWGSAVHGLYANTTWFPLIASVSTRPERSSSKEPTEVETHALRHENGELPAPAAGRSLFCRFFFTTWCR